MTTEKISTIEWLQSRIESTKLTPELWSTLQKLLKEKYWIEEPSPYDITREELQELQSIIEKSQNVKWDLERFLYDDFVETRLQREWLSSVNLDLITTWIENPRIVDMRTEYEKVVNPLLAEYSDIFDSNTQNIIKIWIANRLFSDSVWAPFEWIRSDLDQIWMSIKWFDALKTSEQIEELKKKWASMQEIFLVLIWEYKDMFEAVRKKLEWKTKEEKFAIISNNKWFRTFSLIEEWPNSFNIEELDLTKTTLNDSFDLQSFKDYILNSRWKLDKAIQFTSWGDNLAEFIYSTWDTVVWRWIEKLLWFLFKIPFIWKILAIFLGLNPDNPMEELLENKKDFRFLKSLKSLWKTVWENWELKKEWVWVFKDIDLSSLNFNILKGEIRSIKKIVPDLKEENYDDFWQKSFVEWYTLADWYQLKFELSESQKSSSKLETWDVKQIIKDGLNKYELHKQEEARKKQEEEARKRQAELEAESQKTQAEVSTLNETIVSINWVLNRSYENLWDWRYDSLINWNWIENVKIQDILNTTWDDFSSSIIKMIWEWDYNWLSSEEKTLLNTFFSLIKEYIWKNNIQFNWDLEDFLEVNSSWFNSFLSDKKAQVEEQRWEREQRLWEISSETSSIDLWKSIEEKINSINEETLLSNWIEVWDWIIIKFDRENQILSIWENNYKISLLATNFIKTFTIELEDIKITSESIEIVPKSMFSYLIWDEKRKVSKSSIIDWIKTVIMSWKYQYESSSWIKFNIEKI